MATTRLNQQQEDSQPDSTLAITPNTKEKGELTAQKHEAMNSLASVDVMQHNTKMIETPCPPILLKNRYSLFSDTESSSPSSPHSSEDLLYEEKSNWVEYNDLAIHRGFFNKGLIVVKQSMGVCDFTSLDDSTLIVKERELLFSEMQKKTSSEFTKANKLLSAIKDFVGEKQRENNRNLSITNAKRREEVFLPLSLKNEPNHLSDVSGLYMYPWLSSGNILANQFAFSGFKQYVTAGCLFGSNLIGMDEKGYKCALIKHDIDFYEKQKIQHIQLTSKTLGPYEVALFKELEGLALFINQYADKKADKPSLFYHLPSHDYILFGIDLYIRNRMTLGALTSFLKYVCLQKIKHQEKIYQLCKKYDIQVEISSPFENIFSNIQFDPNSKKAAEHFTQAVLDRLGITIKDNYPEGMDSTMVKQCVTLLMTNKINEKSHHAWVDFLKTNRDEAGVDSIEKLFKIANSLMLGIAAFGKKDYETCSILPLPEKQIQVNYDKLRKEKVIAPSYPGIFCATYIPSVISYASCDVKNNGLLFYFGENLEVLNTVIEKLAGPANENLLTYIENSKKPLNELSDILFDRSPRIAMMKSPTC